MDGNYLYSLSSYKSLVLDLTIHLEEYFRYLLTAKL